MPRQIVLPLQEAQVRSLELNEFVELTGQIFTARDAVHKYLAGQPDSAQLPDLSNGVFYHCGPVVIRDGEQWKITAAGPTTSIREEPYMADIIQKYRLRGIIGKGGMGEKTARACRECGCVYFHAVGGAAQILAKAVTRITKVYFLEEFGFPEALWCLNVERFPAVVTMDAKGNSLHQQVLENSKRQLEKALA